MPGQLLRRNYPAHYLGGTGNGQVVRRQFSPPYMPMRRTAIDLTLTAPSAFMVDIEYPMPEIEYNGVDSDGVAQYHLFFPVTPAYSRVGVTFSASGAAEFALPTTTYHSASGLEEPGLYYTYGGSSPVADIAYEGIGTPLHGDHWQIVFPATLTATLRHLYGPFFGDPAGITPPPGLTSQTDNAFGAIGRWVAEVRASVDLGARILTSAVSGRWSAVIERPGEIPNYEYQSGDGAGEMITGMGGGGYADVVAYNSGTRHRVHGGVLLDNSYDASWQTPTAATQGLLAAFSDMTLTVQQP